MMSVSLKHGQQSEWVASMKYETRSAKWMSDVHEVWNTVNKVNEWRPLSLKHGQQSEWVMSMKSKTRSAKWMSDVHEV